MNAFMKTIINGLKILVKSKNDELKSSLLVELDEFKKPISYAQTMAEHALMEANNALDEIVNVYVGVNEAKTTAYNARTAANNAQTKADNVQLAVDNVNQKTAAFSSASVVTETITVTRSSGTSGDKASTTSLPRATANYYLSYEGNALPTKESLVDSSYKIKYASGTTSSKLSVTESNICVSDQGDKAIFVAEVGFIVTEAGTYTFSKYGTNAVATFNKRGIYLVYSADAQSYVCRFKFGVISTVAKADFGSDGLALYSNNGKKFYITVDGGVISTENASDNTVISMIPSPTSAKVGQVITVKTVDSNGVPIAWEAVDLSANAVSDAAGETVTGAEFNALLTSLRAAGLLNSV